MAKNILNHLLLALAKVSKRHVFPVGKIAKVLNAERIYEQLQLTQHFCGKKPLRRQQN